MRPVIGIPSHADMRAGSGRPIFCNNRSYVHAIERAGGIPLLIPLFNDISALETLLPRLDGILLSGGADVQPSHYGEERHPLIDAGDPQLDEHELHVAALALEVDIPILGICRGMQILNIALGGNLYQDLNDQYPGSIEHCNRNVSRNELTHSVFVEAGSRMEAILGTREFQVNSLHHQAVKRPGKGIHISGRAEDGVAELLEAPNYTFVVAVQCHPEEIDTKVPACRHLFSAFVQACAENSGIIQHAPAEVRVAS